MIRIYKYLALVGVVVFAGIAIYKITIGKPDYTLFIIPLILLALYMRQRGLRRFQKINDEQDGRGKRM